MRTPDLTRPETLDQGFVIVVEDEADLSSPSSPIYVASLYEDDGYGYRDGDFLLSRYEAERVGDQVNVTVKTIAGNRDRPARNVVVRLLLDGREVMGAGAEGQTIVIR